MPQKPLTDAAALRLLGHRIARNRLNRNMTQDDLAAEAGVSTPTLQRMENGRSTQTANLIRVLRALRILDNLDALIPEPPVSPLQQVKLRGRTRQRASSPRSKKDERWSWGEDE